MDRKIVQMAIGFKTEGTSMNHPPEIDSNLTGQTYNTLSYMYDPDLNTVPFMNNHVTNTNQATAINNQGNSEMKSNEENENKQEK